MMLKQLVEELATEARHVESIESSAPALTSLWVRGVNTLHDRIEGIYLIDYLLARQVTLAREPVWNYAARLGRFEVNALRIRVGKRHLVLRPEYQPSLSALGVVVVENNGGAASAEVALSRRDEDGWQWTVPATGTILQRLLRPLLPPLAVPLDEPHFARVMERALLGRQPLFTGNSERLRSRFGDLIDRAGEVRRDARLEQVAAHIREGSQRLTGRFRPSARPMLAAPKRPGLAFGPQGSRQDQHPSAR